jgi:CO/xanthine dehydrogenase Mo-binding subunit
MGKYSAIGTPIPRIEGPQKVSGRATYAADRILPGMIWGKALRSPVAHARVVKIDTSRAESYPGVLAVVTAKDLPDVLVGRRLRDMPMLASDRVRFIGEKVAAVAAEDPQVADEAAALIEVEYDEMRGTFDPAEAMREGAPILHERLSSYVNLPQPPSRIPNVHSELHYAIGDIEEGFSRAKHVFENTFKTQLTHHGYLEPYAAAVDLDAAGRVQVWTTNKMPYALRAHLADAVGIPEEKIVINLCPIGGDFGGKGALMDIPLCYFLAKKTGRPVKMVMTYTEELMAANPRHPSFITIRTGVTGNGKLCAQKVHAVFNSGAYGAFKPTPSVNLLGAGAGAGVYCIPNVTIDAYSVYTNSVPCGHVRAPGEPQTIFAVESQMDMIAHELKMSPLDFRRQNLLKDGDLLPNKHRIEHVRVREALEAAVKAANWDKAKPRRSVGRGIALSHRHVGQGQSTAEVALERDGSITLLTTVPDTGTGSHTILGQIVAETLSIPVDLVNVAVGTTDTFESDAGAGGSRVTHVAGQAALRAAEGAKEEFRSRAAPILDRPTQRVLFERGYLRADDEPERALSLKELAQRLAERGEQVRVRRTYDAKGHGEITCFAAQVAEVEVDRGTGAVKVTKIVTAQDVGTILNPLGHQGQIEGGIIQGVGFALIEEMKTEAGRISTLSLGDFKLPTIQDIPELKTVLVQDPVGPAPFHGKSIGEHSISPVAPAIANALFDAVGVRITELPISAEKIFFALQQKGDRRAA